MTLYMKTTYDEYELPIAVADTPKELAKMIGTSTGVVSSSISHGRSTFHKIVIEDREEVEE